MPDRNLGQPSAEKNEANCLVLSAMKTRLRHDVTTNTPGSALNDIALLLLVPVVHFLLAAEPCYGSGSAISLLSPFAMIFVTCLANGIE